VRGEHATSTARRAADLLPLESAAVPWERGWVGRLPVRAERILVRKQAVVHERVVVRRRQIAHLARLESNVRREQLAVEIDGDADMGGAPGRNTETLP
jgi:uncharacterized protein (TIGR02271 family)